MENLDLFISDREGLFSRYLYYDKNAKPNKDISLNPKIQNKQQDDFNEVNNYETDTAILLLLTLLYTSSFSEIF